MKELFHFLQYHNAIPIALGVLVVGSGAAFAATNPEAIYASQQQVVSIDNTYIANKDLENWTPQVRIGAVTEDDENYHVTYALSTIDLDGYAWKDVVKDETMTVSKADLGQYRDLGVYVTQQLRQIIDRELQRLTETQTFERRSVSLAVVATEYSGLVGALLTDSTETLPGYTPVVVAAAASAVPGTFSAPSSGSGGAVGGSSAHRGASVQIGLQVLGNNPARIPLGAAYADLGVALIDPYGTNVGVHTFVDGVEQNTPSLDTSTSTSYAIEYRATDRSGADIMVRRIVIVGDAPDPGGVISEAGNVAPVVVQPLPVPTAPVQEPETAQDTATTTPDTPIVEEAATSTPVVEEAATSTSSDISAEQQPEAAVQEPEAAPDTATSTAE